MPKKVSQKVEPLSISVSPLHSCSLQESRSYSHKVFKLENRCCPTYIRKNGLL